MHGTHLARGKTLCASVDATWGNGTDAHQLIFRAAPSRVRIAMMIANLCRGDSTWRLVDKIYYVMGGLNNRLLAYFRKSLVCIWNEKVLYTSFKTCKVQIALTFIYSDGVSQCFRRLLLKKNGIKLISSKQKTRILTTALNLIVISISICSFWKLWYEKVIFNNEF